VFAIKENPNMGQYWMVVNLDKKEFVDPHKLGTGLKLWEQLANHPATGAALIVLCAAMPEARGGGDFDLDANWHGPERKFPEHNMTPAPMPEDYQAIAKRTIGRWAGNRISLVGDYAEDGDLPKKDKASKIYSKCCAGKSFKDITEDVCAVIEHELNGKYTDDGYRHFLYNDKSMR
jgi:hypothetical protein